MGSQSNDKQHPLRGRGPSELEYLVTFKDGQRPTKFLLTREPFPERERRPGFQPAPR